MSASTQAPFTFLAAVCACTHAEGTGLTLMAPCHKYVSSVLFMIMIGFRIYSIGVAADFSSGYRNVRLNKVSALVRLLIWFRDPTVKGESEPLVLAQPAPSFGDVQASTCLEIVLNKVAEDATM